VAREETWVFNLLVSVNSFLFDEILVRLISREVFAYGSAQFLFSALVAFKPMPIIWIWTGTEVILATIALLQLWYPFLNYFWAWMIVMFMVGGCVGGSVTNTNFKIAEDLRRAGESDEVRSFANSYAGLGNFGGDALGGALGLVIEMVVAKGLEPRT
jgi:hypothetical protein